MSHLQAWEEEGAGGKWSRGREICKNVTVKHKKNNGGGRRRNTCVSYEEEDTCGPYEEDDTFVSYEEDDTCVS